MSGGRLGTAAAPPSRRAVGPKAEGCPMAGWRPALHTRPHSSQSRIGIPPGRGRAEAASRFTSVRSSMAVKPGGRSLLAPCWLQQRARPGHCRPPGFLLPRRTVLLPLSPATSLLCAPAALSAAGVLHPGTAASRCAFSTILLWFWKFCCVPHRITQAEHLTGVRQPPLQLGDIGTESCQCSSSFLREFSWLLQGSGKEVRNGRWGLELLLSLSWEAFRAPPARGGTAGSMELGRELRRT